MRILLADDSVVAANATAQLIRLALPHEVEVAYGGMQARAASEAYRPDVVILDLDMPDLDGIEVARCIRRFYRRNPPYLIALTGWPDAAQRLPVLDKLFDRVFAKPPDVDHLLAVLARLGTNQLDDARDPVPLDLADLFTRSARRVVPLVVARQLDYAFDYRGPGLIVEDDPVNVQSAFHRLLLGLVDIMAGGFVMFGAEAHAASSGGFGLTVEATGLGPLRQPADIATVLKRLDLVGDARSAAKRGVWSGQGICPNTGATVTYSVEPREGVLLRAVFSYADAVAAPEPEQVDGQHVRAWLVDESEAPTSSLQRRLQRLGWSARRFGGGADVIEHLQSGDGSSIPALPSLLVVADSPNSDIAGLEQLRQALPSSTQCVLAVMAGSPLLASPAGMAGYDIRVLPFSPVDLAEFGDLSSSTPLPSGSPIRAASLWFEPRPSVLLVDDNEVNRLVGRGLLEAMGYEVRTANDGLDALDQCRQMPPRIVLMDLEMPVLRGIEATLRLRALQKTGAIAPFAILAATSDDSEGARAQCQRAGMDGFLAKPLVPSELQAQLRRFTAI